jgi:hypothetical protein
MVATELGSCSPMTRNSAAVPPLTEASTEMGDSLLLRGASLATQTTAVPPSTNRCNNGPIVAESPGVTTIPVKVAHGFGSEQFRVSFPEARISAEIQFYGGSKHGILSRPQACTHGIEEWPDFKWQINSDA